jgi:hypothetical protein
VEFEREGVRIRVEDASDTQVLRVRLTRHHLAEDDRGHAGTGDGDGRSDGRG